MGMGELEVVGECHLERNRLLKECSEGNFCNPRRLRSALLGMCEGDIEDLQEMSYRALEQLVCISGVVVMCLVLYAILILIEYLVHMARGTHKRREAD